MRGRLVMRLVNYVVRNAVFRVVAEQINLRLSAKQIKRKSSQCAVSLLAASIAVLPMSGPCCMDQD